jgi:hypothetical protein
VHRLLAGSIRLAQPRDFVQQLVARPRVVGSRR